MGLIADSEMFKQAKKGQGETNARLDALLAAQQETNRLLATLIQVLTGPAQRPPAHFPPPARR